MAERTIVAIPTIGEGGLESERSGHFGHCDCFTLVEIEGDAIAAVRTVQNPPHVEGGCLTPVNLLASHDVDAILVAGMGARPLAGFNQVGIAVYFESATPNVGEAVQLLLSGDVELMDERFVCGGH